MSYAELQVTTHFSFLRGASSPEELFAAAGISAREAMRTNVPEAEPLLDEKVTDAKIIDAMVEHPILVNRPIVVTPKGVRLARPKETVNEIL